VTVPQYRKARDANEPEIIAELEAVGAAVVRLDPSVAGLPDLLVGYRGRNILMEVKMPPGPQGGTSHAPLSEDQLAFMQAWPGPCVVVRTPKQALHALEDATR
jgi:hypothetical protein